MRVELPEFTRCCCCLPLRLGLIVFVYIKVIAALLILGLLVYGMIHGLNNTMYTTTPRFFWEIFNIALNIIALICEISLGIVFIVGGHRKNYKLMRKYYYFAIVILIYTIIRFTYMSVRTFVFLVQYLRPDDMMHFVSFQLTFITIYIIVQIYFIFLIRSEIMKLKNSYEFRFQNLTAEAQNNLQNETNNAMSTKEHNSDELGNQFSI